MKLKRLPAPKVLFIKPYWKATAATLASPPLGLLYLSSSLKKRFPDAQTRLLDLRFLKNRGRLESIIEEWTPDIVAIQCLAGDDYAIRSLSSKIKRVSASVHICCGGPYATHSPEIFNDFKDVDSIIRGEGEKSFCILAEHICSKNRLSSNIGKGIAIRSPEGYLETPGYSDPFQNPDDIPLPDWSLTDIDLYSRTSHVNSVMAGKRYMVLFTSRGCPFSCIYCHNIFGKKFRMRSPLNVVNEIETLVKDHRIDEIQIIDDIFNFNRERLIRICDLIIEKNLKVNICFPNGVRGDMLDRELILKLKKAGTYMITFAIETASERIQRLIRKNLDINKTIEAIKFASSIGLITRSFFIIGFPTETEDEIRQTINLPKSLPLTTFSIFKAIPFKGTDLYNLVLSTASNEAIRSLNTPLGSFFAQTTFYSIDTGINLNKYIFICYFKFFTPLRLIKFFIKIPQKRLYLKQLTATLLVGFYPKDPDSKNQTEVKNNDQRLYKIETISHG